MIRNTILTTLALSLSVLLIPISYAHSAPRPFDTLRYGSTLYHINAGKCDNPVPLPSCTGVDNAIKTPSACVARYNGTSVDVLNGSDVLYGGLIAVAKWQYAHCYVTAVGIL